MTLPAAGSAAPTRKLALLFLAAALACDGSSPTSSLDDSRCGPYLHFGVLGRSGLTILVTFRNTEPHPDGLQRGLTTSRSEGVR